jgi:hypothetical protein
MTLTLTVVAPWGVWQCADHRLTKAGRVVDDYSIKQVQLRCSDGMALICYSGVGQDAGKYGVRDLSEWLRGMLRGEPRTVDQSLILIRERANAQLQALATQCGIWHQFSVATVLGGRPWWAAITNARRPAQPGGTARLGSFETAAGEIKRGTMVLYTGPVFEPLPKQDVKLLLRLSQRGRRHPKEYSRILAMMNRRAAANPEFGHLISPHCQTVHIPIRRGVAVEGAGHALGHYSDSARPPKPMVIPHLLFGIDLTDVTRQHLDDLSKGLPLSMRDDLMRRAVQPEQ